MKAGALRTRVFIEQQSTTQDAAGQPLTTWTTLATVWAEIRYRRGLESIQADQMTSQVSCRIRIRWRTDVHAGMRVRSAGTTFNIHAVLPEEVKREYVDLVCEVQP